MILPENILLWFTDQCLAGQNDCDPHAVCKPTRKSYRCVCKKGWEGNGRSCAGTL